MPIYEYRCAACGHQKEVLQKISDAPLTECPECKQPTFGKQLSAAGFQLKGSGWYATDFKGGSAAAASSEPAKPAEAKSGEAKGGEAAAPAPAAGCGGSCACH